MRQSLYLRVTDRTGAQPLPAEDYVAPTQLGDPFTSLELWRLTATSGSAKTAAVWKRPRGAGWVHAFYHPGWLFDGTVALYRGC